ncbi:MAG TPA: hypothetical protein GX517_00090 [Alicyclobacillus sp.]|nr:hypothetical protein [Alicyclobacillus sp.]
MAGKEEFVPKSTGMNTIVVAAETIESLEKRIQRLEQENAELAAKVAWYEEQFRLSQRRRFAASSQWSKSTSEQLQLFNEAEVEAQTPPPSRRGNGDGAPGEKAGPAGREAEGATGGTDRAPPGRGGTGLPAVWGRAA